MRIEGAYMQGYATLNDMMRAGDATPRAVRWWEEQGLLGDVGRYPNGHRKYTSEHLERAKFIGACQEAGFSLAEIQLMIQRRPFEQVKIALKAKGKKVQMWLDRLPEYDI